MDLQFKTYFLFLSSEYFGSSALKYIILLSFWECFQIFDLAQFFGPPPQRSKRLVMKMSGEVTRRLVRDLIFGGTLQPPNMENQLQGSMDPTTLDSNTL